MQIEQTAIPEVLILTPKRFGDARGFFAESWNRRTLEDAGVHLPEFVQDNYSLSYKAGTIRGLHYQAPPYAQGKLVRCGRGRFFDVVVDARKGSPTYGKWVGEELSFENSKQLWIPAGFLHGFMTLENDTEIIYKCTNHYAAECDGGVLWSSCGIEWPNLSEPILSDKDIVAPPFAEFDSPFQYEA